VRPTGTTSIGRDLVRSTSAGGRGRALAGAAEGQLTAFQARR